MDLVRCNSLVDDVIDPGEYHIHDDNRMHPMYAVQTNMKYWQLWHDYDDTTNEISN